MRGLSMLHPDGDPLHPAERTSTAPVSQGSGSASPAYQAAEAATARNVSGQVLATVAQMRDGTATIRLNPEELGRVRLSLTPTEQGLTVVVLAERAETADLMRRHADTFLSDLKDLGYAQVELEFRDAAQQEKGGRDADAAEQPAADTATEENETKGKRSPVGQIDLLI